MFHTERDAATFFAEMLLLAGAGVGAVYGAGVLVALVLKAFRSSRALYISLVLSAIASVPVVLAVVLQWRYLPDEWGKNPTVGVLLLVDTALLAFVWAAPVTQYRLVRRNRGGKITGGSGTG